MRQLLINSLRSKLLPTAGGVFLFAVAFATAAVLTMLMTRDVEQKAQTIDFRIFDETGKSIGGPSASLRIKEAGRYKIEPIDQTSTPEALLFGDRNLRFADGTAVGGKVTQTANGLLWRVENSDEHRPPSITIEVAGHATVTVKALPASAANRMVRDEYAISYLFAGGLGLMTLFSCVVSLTSRDKLFGVFAFWLWNTFALGSINAGYDLLWFGPLKSIYLETTLKKLICASWGFAALHLFRSLFANELRSSLLKNTLRILQGAFLAFCVLAPITPTPIFMALVWATAIVGLTLLAVGVVAIWLEKITLATIWYGLGWFTQITAMTREVMGASGISNRPEVSPFTIAAVVSSLFVGLAVSQSLNSERSAKLIAFSIAERARNQLARLFASSPTGLLSFELSGVQLASNPKAKELLDVSESSGISLKKLFNPSEYSQIDFALQSGQNDVNLRVARDLTEGRGKRFLSVHVHKTDVSIEVSLHDITASVVLEENLSQQAYTDPLTGLRNFAALSKDLIQLQETTWHPRILLVDIDRFRNINAFYGQHAGDQTLIEVSRRLSNFAGKDFSYRISSNTFAYLLPTFDDRDVLDIARMLKKEVTELPIDLGRRTLFVQVYAGAYAQSDHLDPDALLLCTQSLLESAKKLPLDQDRIVVSNDATMASWRIGQHYLRLMQSRTWQSHVELFAQPIVGLQSDSSEIFEILLRVKYDHKLQPPVLLIEAAETLGAMTEIDLWVVEHTLRWMETRTRLPKYVTCNLSGASLSDPQFLDALFDLITKHRQAATRLCLEVTESVALRDIQKASAFFDQIHSLGVLIALDDFGSGYTNFTYLSRLPVDVLKLDGQFVREVITSPRKAAILSSLTKLTHDFGAVCVAEWVEDQSCADALCKMGVDFAQGWHFSKAQPLAYWDNNPFPRHVAHVNSASLEKREIDSDAVHPIRS